MFSRSEVDASLLGLKTKKAAGIASEKKREDHWQNLFLLEIDLFDDTLQETGAPAFRLSDGRCGRNPPGTFRIEIVPAGPMKKPCAGKPLSSHSL